MRAVKTYLQFVNESWFAKRGERKKLRAIAREYLRLSKEEREQEWARLEAEGVDMQEFLSAVGDAYDEQW
jgi:hypothetical protein